MENIFVVKLHYGDAIRRIVFPAKPESLAHSDLVSKARQLHSLPMSAPLQLSYLNGEDYEITLAGNSDLKDALLAQKLNPLHVFLEVPAMETSEEEEGSKLGHEASGEAAISRQLGDAPITEALDDLHLQGKGGSEEVKQQHQLDDKENVKVKDKDKEEVEQEKEEEDVVDTMEWKQEVLEEEKDQRQWTCGAPSSQWGPPPGHWWKKKWQRHMRAMEENADKEGKPAEGAPMWPQERGPHHHHRHGLPHHHHGPSHHGPPRHHHGPPHHGPPRHDHGPPHSRPCHDQGPPHSMLLNHGTPPHHHHYHHRHHRPPHYRYQGKPPWGGPGGPWGRFGRWGRGACEVHLNCDSDLEGKRAHRHHHYDGSKPYGKGGPWWAHGPPGGHHHRGGRPPWARVPDDDATDSAAPAPAAAATEEGSLVAALAG